LTSARVKASKDTCALQPTTPIGDCLGVHSLPNFERCVPKLSDEQAVICGYGFVSNPSRSSLLTGLAFSNSSRIISCRAVSSIRCKGGQHALSLRCNVRGEELSCHVSTLQYTFYPNQKAYPNAYAQEARCQGEWKRWQEADKWAWDEVKRQHWAETLWRNQQKRRSAHAALRRNLAHAEARGKQQVPGFFVPPLFCM